MMLFYFDLHEADDVTEDPEGRSLPDLRTARLFALKDARAIMCDELQRGKLPLTSAIHITDTRGEVLYVVSFASAVKLDIYD
jgi:hypothetical protein